MTYPRPCLLLPFLTTSLLSPLSKWLLTTISAGHLCRQVAPERMRGEQAPLRMLVSLHLRCIVCVKETSAQTSARAWKK